MALAHWNCIIPDSSKIAVTNDNNNLEYFIPAHGGPIVLEHNFDSTAPVVGNYLAFLPKQLLDFWIAEMRIMVPQVDSNATPTFRFKVGVIDTDLGQIRASGDTYFWAGTQTAKSAAGALTQTQVSGVAASTDATTDFTAGQLAGGGVVNIYQGDLIAQTPPNAQSAGFTNFNVGLQVTAAAATWKPTDAAKKTLRVFMMLVPRDRRVF